MSMCVCPHTQVDLQARKDAWGVREKESRAHENFDAQGRAKDNATARVRLLLLLLLLLLCVCVCVCVCV